MRLKSQFWAYKPNFHVFNFHNKHVPLSYTPYIQLMCDWTPSWRPFSSFRCWKSQKLSELPFSFDKLFICFLLKSCKNLVFRFHQNIMYSQNPSKPCPSCSMWYGFCICGVGQISENPSIISTHSQIIRKTRILIPSSSSMEIPSDTIDTMALKSSLMSRLNSPTPQNHTQ